MALKLYLERLLMSQNTDLIKHPPRLTLCVLLVRNTWIQDNISCPEFHNDSAYTAASDEVLYQQL